MSDQLSDIWPAACEMLSFSTTLSLSYKSKLTFLEVCHSSHIIRRSLWLHSVESHIITDHLLLSFCQMVLGFIINHVIVVDFPRPGHLLATATSLLHTS